ncbi:MAG: preprotein translocase subunit SecG [Spirochaetales bacterium]
MGVIGLILLVVFIIICILLIAIILIQKDEGGGLGGLFGGGSVAFGSRSQTVITKTTYIFVTLFFLASFGLAILNRAPAVQNLDETARQLETMGGSDSGQSWLDADDTAEETLSVEADITESSVGGN